MTDTSFPWLSLIVWFPLIGAILLFVVNTAAVRWVAFAFATVEFVLSLFVWFLFDPTRPDMQLTERLSWITSPPIHYSLGVDGISLPLVLLTTLITPFCVLTSWNTIKTRLREFMAMLLIMETAMLGVFVALDFVLFYVFWEAMLIPM